MAAAAAPNGLAMHGQAFGTAAQHIVHKLESEPSSGPRGPGQQGVRHHLPGLDRHCKVRCWSSSMGDRQRL